MFLVGDHLMHLVPIALHAVRFRVSFLKACEALNFDFIVGRSVCHRDESLIELNFGITSCVVAKWTSSSSSECEHHKCMLNVHVDALCILNFICDAVVLGTCI